MRPPHRIIRHVILTIAASLILIGGIGLYLRSIVQRGHTEMKAYRDAHSPSLIVGRQVDAIVAKYGKPYFIGRGPDKQVESIMYKQMKYGQYCGIEFENGAAVRVNFWVQ